MTMNRRDWISTAGLLAGGMSARVVGDFGGPTIETVTGPKSTKILGFVLPHEHVLVDFIGAEQATPERYDRDEVVRVVLPHLRRARELGVATLFECTPAHLGRDPILLRRLADESRLNLITNTGFYAANGGKHLPEHARRESVEQIAARWIAEANHGIDGTGIKPGFIKIGVDAGPLDEVGRKLVRAAAHAHRATGLAIAAHTGDGRAALDQLAILDEEGVDASAWIWLHAQNDGNRELHRRVAERGAWLEFDDLSPERIDEYVRLVIELKDAGRLNQLLISHDAGWFHVGEAGGGVFRPFDTLIALLVPALRQAGLSNRDLTRIVGENPRAAFTPAVRR